MNQPAIAGPINDEADSFQKTLNANNAAKHLSWMPEGTKPAELYIEKPAAGPVQTAPNEAGACRKEEAVRVLAEIRQTSVVGSREVHLTIKNGASEKVERAFVAHKNGKWGTPGRQDVEAGAEMKFVSDTGAVSRPVAYRCVAYEDSQKSTLCFPPKWWLNKPPTVPVGKQ